MLRGDALGAAGRYPEAAEVYAKVSESGATDELRARALFELARLASESGNPERDARRTSEYLDRLVREYPSTRWAAYARSWNEALREVRKAREESVRAEQEVLSLRQELHELTKEMGRRRDAIREVERLRQRLMDAERDAASLRDDLQRLKALELELEQRQRRP